MAAHAKPPPRMASKVTVEVVEAELVEETAMVTRRPGALSIRKPSVRTEDDLYATWVASKSETTARNYKIDLADFAKWGGYEDIGHAVSEICDLDGPDANRMVFEYKNYLKKEKYAASTVNRRLAALRSITKLARLFGIIDWMLEVDGEKARAYKDTTGCGRVGVMKMLAVIHAELSEESIRTTRAAYLRRAKAIICLMYHGGLRRMELLTIRYSEDLRLHRQSGEQEVSIAGKKRGDERDWVPIGPTAWAAVHEWVRARGDFSGPLFHGQSKEDPLDPCTINEYITWAATKAGIKATPHGIRHAAITELLERTGDIRVAQRFARHSSPATTMIYDDNRQHLAARGVRALEDEPEEVVSKPEAARAKKQATAAAKKKPAAKPKPAAKKPR